MILSTAKAKVRKAIKQQARYDKMKENHEYKDLGFRNIIATAHWGALQRLGVEDSTKLTEWYNKLDLQAEIKKYKGELE
jgi:hypothetical protein